MADQDRKENQELTEEELEAQDTTELPERTETSIITGTQLGIMPPVYPGETGPLRGPVPLATE